MRALFAAVAVLSQPTIAFAQPFTFNSDPTTPVYQAIAKQFVNPALGTVGSDAAHFGWARADVDGDGYDELFVRLLGSEFCADGDCPVIGYRKANEGHWPAILTTMSTETTITGGRLVTSSYGISTTWRWDTTAEMLVSD